MALRTGLFGGSFDPAHLAHLALAHCALEQLNLDKVLWLPAGQPWQKQGRRLASAEHRCAMVELLIEGEPRFELDASELERVGPSYTIDTVRARSNQELVLIIGQDQYARLHTWHEWRELLKRVTLAVAARAGEAVKASAELAAEPHQLLKLALPAMHISSTEVREQASRGEDIRPLVGEAVAGYIAQHRLYSEH